MADSLASRIIRAYQAGQQAKQQREDRKFEIEERARKLKQDQAIMKRKEALENRALNPFPVAPEVQTSAPQTTSMPFPGQVGQPQTSNFPPQSTPLPLPPDIIPSATGGPDFMAPVVSLQQKLQQDALARQQGLQDERAKMLMQREVNTFTVPDPATGQSITAPKEILDNLLTQSGQNKRQEEQQKFTADENEKRIQAENERNQANILARLQAAKIRASVAANGQLVQAVIDNPTLYDDLTPTVRSRIAPELAKAGFSGFGKKLSESAITKLSDARSAIASLEDLREVLKTNEQYIGPIAGLAAINPYSDARKAQADINRVKQRVGKALEGGVLRKEDEQKYKEILATLTDTPTTAIYKVDNMIRSMEQDIELFTEEQRKAGRNVNPTGQGEEVISGVGTFRTNPDGSKTRIK